MSRLTKRTTNWLVAAALLALGNTIGLAQEAHILSRPLNPQEIVDYGLPSTTQVSGGLNTVGVGSAVYLEALVPKGTQTSNLVWALTAQPSGSTAALTPSPLTSSVPIYEPADREDYDIAGRQRLIPDKVGTYTVTATAATTADPLELTLDITVSTYMGAPVSCVYCHSGGFLPDKYNPWSQTGHATMLTEAIDGIKSSHYSGDCISCHTVGYDTASTATNGGFDDIAASLGWTFPTNLVPGNWDALPQALKNVSNIQCENCHGPGSQHAYSLGDTSFISVSFSAGDCAQCHSEGTHHIKPDEWVNSRHAITVREESSSCTGCHGGKGFVDRMNGLPQSEWRTEYSAITCATCHDPHDATNPHQVRGKGSVTLLDTSRPGGATVVTNGGNGMVCMNCHMSRRDAVTYVEGTGSSHFGPHHGPQTDMLMGVNAITYDETIPSTAHYKVVADTCATCHMQPTLPTDATFLKAGGHTFAPSWDGGTPDDPSDDVDLVGACMQCHGPIASFDFPRQDYNGDGVIEGVQTEVEHLLHDLAMMLPPIGQPTVEITAAYTKQQLKAVYNYLFVEEDGSKGVHNLSYAVGLLKAAIADLTGDADKDGLLDSWEIANFGSIQAQNGQGDADNDGVSNAMEMCAGTNPNLADTDGDGQSDKMELLAGSDPLNAQDMPQLRIKILGAAELKFATEVGKTYQLQVVSELKGTWQDVGEPVDGTGEMVSYLTSTDSEAPQYYRVKVLP